MNDVIFRIDFPKSRISTFIWLPLEEYLILRIFVLTKYDAIVKLLWNLKIVLHMTSFWTPTRHSFFKLKFSFLFPHIVEFGNIAEIWAHLSIHFSNFFAESPGCPESYNYAYHIKNSEESWMFFGLSD